MHESICGCPNEKGASSPQYRSGNPDQGAAKTDHGPTLPCGSVGLVRFFAEYKNRCYPVQVSPLPKKQNLTSRVTNCYVAVAATHDVCLQSWSGLDGTPRRVSV